MNPAAAWRRVGRAMRVDRLPISLTRSRPHLCPRRLRLCRERAPSAERRPKEAAGDLYGLAVQGDVLLQYVPVRHAGADTVRDDDRQHLERR